MLKILLFFLSMLSQIQVLTITNEYDYCFLFMPRNSQIQNSYEIEINNDSKKVVVVIKVVKTNKSKGMRVLAIVIVKPNNINKIIASSTSNSKTIVISTNNKIVASYHISYNYGQIDMQYAQIISYND